MKSLRSYHSVRESLGKMHAYVERVSKLDSNNSHKKHSASVAGAVLPDESMAPPLNSDSQLNASSEKLLNRS